MDKAYKLADISPRIEAELKRMETHICRDTGKEILLIAYEPQAMATPVFNDLQTSGSAELKTNTFQSKDNLNGNITQWHV